MRSHVYRDMCKSNMHNTNCSEKFDKKDIKDITCLN